MADPEQAHGALGGGTAGDVNGDRTVPAEAPAVREPASTPVERSDAAARKPAGASERSGVQVNTATVTVKSTKTSERGRLSSTTKRRALIVLLYVVSFVLLGVWFFAVRSWVEVPKTQLELGIGNVGEVERGQPQQNLENTMTSSFRDLGERQGIGTFLLVTAVLLSYAGMVLNLIDSVLEWFRARRERKEAEGRAEASAGGAG